VLLQGASEFRRQFHHLSAQQRDLLHVLPQQQTAPSKILLELRQKPMY
jgi:hypothetical protein